MGGRKRTIVAAVALAIVALGGASIALARSAGHSSGAGAGRPTADAGVPGWVTALAQRIATENGDPSPSAVQAVATTRGLANRAAGGDLVDSDQPVYLVAMSGTFVDPMASVPAGAAFPSGSVVTFVADAATERVLDFGIGDVWPHLDRLGHASRVALR